MPELPEVQTLINQLIEDGVCNKKITNVEIYLEKIIKNSSKKHFIEFIKNEKIKKIDRIGKYLIFHLTNDKVLSIHLRMEGKLFFLDDENKANISTKHMLIKFDMGKNNLLYFDTRRFGTFNIYNESNYRDSKELSKIALDPLDENFTWQYLKNNISKSKKAIKTALLDQTKVSGIGNIYADEILFASKIIPTRLASSITDNEFKLIAKNSKLILNKAIENKGTTIFSYLYKNNESGSFQKFLKVHLKKDKPCSICKNLIVKIKVNGRGTYYCPCCQK